MDLDLPPSKRWSAVITDKKTDVRVIGKHFAIMLQVPEKKAH